MSKLNQVIAAEQGVRSRTSRRVTDLYHTLQKGALFTGLSRTYKPRDDEGERLPAERTQVQERVERNLREVAKAWTPLWDIVLTKDEGNTSARANIVVDDLLLARDVPVTYLLFLEKQLTDLRTVLNSLPLLDPSERWSYDEASDCYVTEPSETTRTKKVPRAHVLYEATDKHPAQVQSFTEDVIVGYWEKVVFSGAVPASRKRELADRLDKLIIAVKEAREEANSIEVEQQEIAADLFDYVLTGE